MTDLLIDHDRVDRVAQDIALKLTKTTANPIEGLLAILKALVIIHKSLDVPLEDAITKLREAWEVVDVQKPS